MKEGSLFSRNPIRKLSNILMMAVMSVGADVICIAVSKGFNG
jgi:hypothetical protein